MTSIQLRNKLDLNTFISRGKFLDFSILLTSLEYNFIIFLLFFGEKFLAT